MIPIARRKTKIATGLAILIVAGAAAGWYHYHHLPKRFGVVVPGRLYRSGRVSPAELATVARRYHVRTVLSLLDPDAPESIRERRAAERLGLRWVNVPLRGDGSSTPDDRARIEAVLFDPHAAPLLVHCAAGANRTGLAVGLYRICKQGWSLERVLAEMRRYGFEDQPRHANLRAALREAWQQQNPAKAGKAASSPPP